MKIIGQGKCATVYAYGDGRALKLFHPHLPDAVAEHEFNVIRIVNGLGISSPRCFGMIERDGRKGIVYQMVSGKSLLGMMLSSPLKIFRYARLLAEIHYELHRSRGDGLPHFHGEFRLFISQSRNELGAMFGPLNAYLDALNTGNAVLHTCHGDFHPDNIMAADNGMMIIDWANAYRGDPCADAARSHLMFISPTRSS